MYFTLPFIDRIAYVIDTREKSVPIHPQHAITRDNVSVQIDGVVYVQVVDPEKAAYRALNPFLAVIQHAQSTMRAAIGRRSLDDAFHDRAFRSRSRQAPGAWHLVVPETHAHDPRRA